MYLLPLRTRATFAFEGVFPGTDSFDTV